MMTFEPFISPYKLLLLWANVLFSPVIAIKDGVTSEAWTSHTAGSLPSGMQLQHLHVLFRHGDRTPIEDILHTSVPFEQIWPLGRGQLTEEGILQEFELGQWIRKSYADFIPMAYNASEFHMRSTDLDRTLMSAQAVAAGIYQNISSPLQPFGIAWRPIPVHTVRQEADVLLSVAKCPCLDVLRDIQMNSDAAVNFEKSHHSLFQLINENMKPVKIDRFNHWKLVDLFICMKAHNRSLPSWCTEQVFQEMLEVDKFYWMLQYASTRDILRMEMGVFLSAFLEHLRSITKGTKSPTTKGHHLSVQHTMVYSAHDTDVTYLLGALGAFQNETIPYSSAVVLELLGPHPPSPTESYHLRLLYKRGYLDTVGEYRTLAPCANQSAKDGCPLHLVFNYLEPFLLSPDDFIPVCNGSPEGPWQCVTRPNSNYLVFKVFIAVSVCIVVIGALIVTIVALRSRHRHRRGSSFAQLHPDF